MPQAGLLAEPSVRSNTVPEGCAARPGRNQPPAKERPQRSSLTHGEIALVVSMSAVLLISFIFPPGGLPQVPICYFAVLTGLPCPGCGLTRGFCAIAHGRFADAWAYNPFAFALYGLTVFFLLYPWLTRWFSRLRQRLVRWRVPLWLSLSLVVAMWIFGAWRMNQAKPIQPPASEARAGLK